MKFSGSLLKRVVLTPVEAYRNNHIYYFMMQVPLLIIAMIIMIPVALFVDFCAA